MKPKVISKNRRLSSEPTSYAKPLHTDEFLIAALGASAGGLEAFSELIRNLPPDTGMAFVLIQHLDPTHHSMLADLISKTTRMHVNEVSNGMSVEPNNVYVIPPNTTMSISHHTLTLVPRDASVGMPMPIDHFMRSLSALGNRAVGVVLSGTGSDGTFGLCEIQAQGGVTFAQDSASARHDSMPRSAESAGYADFVLPPKGIARELTRLARHPYISRDGAWRPSVDGSSLPDPSLGGIFQLLRKTTGVDFTHYRQSTVSRRIQRRMVVNNIDNARDYLKFAQKDPAEINALYQSLLISVTSFFRNPDVFDALKADVFPALLRNRRPESSIRLWTPGCASGEETYSIAIALFEFLGDRASETPFQLFGTDASEPSVVKARAGAYPENIQGDVSADRLRRFFTKSENGYRISKIIRDRCIFARHNLLNDPPFSQMELVCCRNLLIYLEPPLQNRVLSLFHYALRPAGYLVLGNSEGIGAATGMFAPENRDAKIFRRKSATPQLVTFSLDRQPEPFSHHLHIPTKPPESTWNAAEVQKEFDRRLLAQYAPAAVFINDELDVLHSRGNIGLYLKIAPGRASHSILKMAREGLLLDLRDAIARAKKKNAAVQKHNIQIKAGDGNGDAEDPTRLVSIEVSPISVSNLKEQLYMVIFKESPREPARETPRRRATPQKESRASLGRVAKLQDELTATKEYLQSLIETQEAMNEQLQSANEEILSSNEELQSTNEELETAKEELQSANEELSTVNDELRSRNIDVNRINNDLNNLLNSIDIAVIMVGNDLTIRRFTPRAQQIYGLIPGDVGRPFLNVNPTIEIPPLQPLVLQVMSDLQTIEEEFTDSQGTCYQLRILPYRAEDRIDGAVITLVNVSALANTAPRRTARSSS